MPCNTNTETYLEYRKPAEHSDCHLPATSNILCISGMSDIFYKILRVSNWVTVIMDLHIEAHAPCPGVRNSVESKSNGSNVTNYTEQTVAKIKIKMRTTSYPKRKKLICQWNKTMFSFPLYFGSSENSSRVICIGKFTNASSCTSCALFLTVSNIAPSEIASQFLFILLWTDDSKANWVNTLIS